MPNYFTALLQSRKLRNTVCRRLLSLVLCFCLFSGAFDIISLADDSLPFEDVDPESWYYPAVSDMYQNEIMLGTNDTHFSPNLTTTRAMAVTVLYRLEGSPEATISPFEDVSPNAYYHDAVAWAYEQQIVLGVSSSRFAPNQEVTREQMVAIIYRYLQYKGSPCSQRSNLNVYKDVGDVSSWALIPFRWSVSAGVIKGRSETRLVPEGEITRAELAQILYGMRSKVLDDPAVFSPVTANVPVLMFHSVVTENPGSYSLTTEDFESIIAMLSESGYQSIDIQDLIDFVDGTSELPENPIMLTFDDGYADNLENACPILAKYGYKAVISVIGCYVGLDTYNETAIMPHFSFEAAQSFVPDVISVQAHTNKMHMLQDYPTLSDGRHGVAKRSSETDEEYYDALIQDFQETYDMIADGITAPTLLAYPYGIFTYQAELAAKQVGYRSTLTTRRGINVVTRGDPESLYLLNRIHIKKAYTAEEFAELVASCAYDA